MIHIYKITRIYIKIINNSFRKSLMKFTILKRISNMIGRKKWNLSSLDKNKKNQRCSKCMKNGSKSIQSSIKLKIKIHLNKQMFIHCKIKDILLEMFCNKSIMLKTLAEILTTMSGSTGKPSSFQQLLCKHKVINYLQDLLSKFKGIPKEFQSLKILLS